MERVSKLSLIFFGQDYFTKNMDVVAKDGRIVILALLSGSVIPRDLQMAPILRKRITICGSNLRGRDIDYQVTVKNKMVNEMMPQMTSGQFNVPIEKVFLFNDIVEAHQLMESNATKGKSVCKIN